MATSNRHRDIIAALGEGFDIRGWERAELELRRLTFAPQPKGSVTVEQYAKIIGQAKPTARRKLLQMKKSGIVNSEQWTNPNRGTCKVYWLKPKKEWPK